MKLGYLKWLLISVVFLLGTFYGLDQVHSNLGLELSKGKNVSNKKITSTKITHKKKFMSDPLEIKPEDYDNLNSFFESESLSYFEQKKRAFCDTWCDSYLERMLSKVMVLDFARSLLLNLDVTYKLYPKNQAYIRLLALDLVKENAAKGDLYSLERLIHHLFIKFNENNKFSGAKEDLTDLLSSWIEIFGKDLIYQKPEILFEKIQYKIQYKDFFARALGNVYPDLIWDRKLSSRFLSFLNKKGGSV